MTNETRKFIRSRMLEGCDLAQKEGISTKTRIPADADLVDCMNYLNDLRASGALDGRLDNVDIAFGVDSTYGVLTMYIKYSTVSVAGDRVGHKPGVRKK